MMADDDEVSDEERAETRKYLLTLGSIVVGGTGLFSAFKAAGADDVIAGNLLLLAIIASSAASASETSGGVSG